jgi:alpha-1,2-glucosyltransferase
MNKLILVLSSLIYFQSSYLISNYINDNVNKPYMDEIFHIPQAQQYCLGNYTEVS